MRQSFYEARVKLLSCEYRLLGYWSATNNALPFWRIYYNEEEGATISFRGEDFAVSPGKLIAIPPNVSVDRQLDHAVHQFSIHAQAAYPFHRLHPQVLEIPVEVDILELIQRLKPVVDREAGSRAFTATQSLWAQTIVLSVLTQVQPEMLVDRVQDPHIEMALTFIEDDIASTLTSDQLASMVNMRQAAFSRLFRDQVGMSPQQYLLEKRLDRAAALLGHSDASVAVIAEECGFSRTSSFSRAFRQNRGIAPVQFREELLL